MNSMLCSRCKKRMAVVFVTRMEGDQTFNEGLCLQCAKELGIKPVEDLMNKMGISGEELDAIIEKFARNWRLDRVGRVELNLLRLGVYEMLYRADVPCKVSMNEALELDKQYGDARSHTFVNGILDAVSKALEKGELKARG